MKIPMKWAESPTWSSHINSTVEKFENPKTSKGSLSLSPTQWRKTWPHTTRHHHHHHRVTTQPTTNRNLRHQRWHLFHLHLLITSLTYLIHNRHRPLSYPTSVFLLMSHMIRSVLSLLLAFLMTSSPAKCTIYSASSLATNLLISVPPLKILRYLLFFLNKNLRLGN
jgi:hypothetical protein